VGKEVCWNILSRLWKKVQVKWCKVEGKVHPCTGTEALYRPYDP